MVAMSNSLVQQYFDSADEIMIAIDSSEKIVDINKKACKMLGCLQTEVIGKNWFEVFVPETKRENAKQFFHKMLKGTLHHVHSEYPVKRKHGADLIMNWHNILISDEKGNAIGTLSSGTDVTELRKAEKAMREIENRLQTTLDAMLEGCQIIDYDWRYAYINETAARHGRKTKRELLGHTMMEMYPGIENTDLFSDLRDCMNRRIPHQRENEFTFSDGSKGWFDLRIEPVPEGILILSLDITKQRELQEELNRYRDRLEEVVAVRTAECAKVNNELTQEIEAHRKMEQGLMLRALILDNAKEAIFLVNLKGDFAYANEAASKTYGYNRDELLTMNFRQLLTTQEASDFESLLKEVFQRGRIESETVHVRKDGSLMPVKVRHSLIKTSHGKFIVSVMEGISANNSR